MSNAKEWVPENGAPKICADFPLDFKNELSGFDFVSDYRAKVLNGGEVWAIKKILESSEMRTVFEHFLGFFEGSTGPFWGQLVINVFAESFDDVLNIEPERSELADHYKKISKAAYELFLLLDFDDLFVTDGMSRFKREDLPYLSPSMIPELLALMDSTTSLKWPRAYYKDSFCCDSDEGKKRYLELFGGDCDVDAKNEGYEDDNCDLSPFELAYKSELPSFVPSVAKCRENAEKYYEMDCGRVVVAFPRDGFDLPPPANLVTYKAKTPAFRFLEAALIRLDQLSLACERSFTRIRNNTKRTPTTVGYFYMTASHWQLVMWLLFGNPDGFAAIDNEFNLRNIERAINSRTSMRDETLHQYDLFEP